MLKIDSHQHFWVFDPIRDNWITEDMAAIRRDFLPGDLKPILEDNHVSACVAVQADQSEKETLFLLDIAERNEFVKAVVGWVDLCSPDITERLNYFQQFPKIKGFRHIVQAEKKGFMLEKSFLDGLAKLKRYEFTFDILVRSSQIQEAIKLVERNPDQKFVLDHIGKPGIKGKDRNNWADDIKSLALHQNVYCKLSGLVTEADPDNWKYIDLYPYMEIALNAFGVNRLMFGSDWPVCKLAGEYEQICEIVSAFVGKLSTAEQELIWSENAIDFYNLKIS